MVIWYYNDDWGNGKLRVNDLFYRPLFDFLFRIFDFGCPPSWFEPWKFEERAQHLKIVVRGTIVYVYTYDRVIVFELLCRCNINNPTASLSLSVIGGGEEGENQ